MVNIVIEIPDASSGSGEEEYEEDLYPPDAETPTSVVSQDSLETISSFNSETVQEHSANTLTEEEKIVLSECEKCAGEMLVIFCMIVIIVLIFFISIIINS